MEINGTPWAVSDKRKNRNKRQFLTPFLSFVNSFASQQPFTIAGATLVFSIPLTGKFSPPESQKGFLDGH